jgi:hypothetical protein
MERILSKVQQGPAKENNANGIINYGPYLSLTPAFFGAVIAVFLFYELLGYYAAAIKVNLPADLANLNFLSFLLRQFTTVYLTHIKYVLFLIGGVPVSAAAAYIVVRFVYTKGLAHGAK